MAFGRLTAVQASPIAVAVVSVAKNNDGMTWQEIEQGIAFSRSRLTDGRWHGLAGWRLVHPRRSSWLDE